MAFSPKTRQYSSVAVVSQQLRALALKKAAHEKLPTLSELCDLLGTSRATLVEALDDLEMQHVIYRQPGKGIFISPLMHRKTICLLLDSSLLNRGNSSFWGNLWGACAHEARRRAEPYNEYHTFHMISTTPGQDPLMPEEIVHMVTSQRIHGFLSIGLRTYAPELLKRPVDEPKSVVEVVTQSRLPCITFANYGRWAIELDFDHFLNLAIQRLVEQGCQRIALWEPINLLADLETHVDIFSLLLTAHHRTFYPELVANLAIIHPDYKEAALSYQEQGYYVALRSFAQENQLQPDGIIVLDDTFMEGVFLALHQLQIPLEERAKVVTHANTGSLRLYERMPNISVIEYDTQDITQTLFTMVHQLLNNEEPAMSSAFIKPKYRV